MTIAGGDWRDGAALERSAVRGATELRLEEITTAEGLDAIRNEWHALLDRCAGATPFQSPEWLLAWWHAMGGGDLHVVTLRRGRRLVGLAPLFVYIEPDWTRHLASIGAGYSDYEDVLLDPTIADEGAALILQHIAAIRDRWDVASFQELPAASPLAAAPCPPGLSLERSPGSSCAVLALPATIEALDAGLSWRFRRRLRNARNRLAREADARFVLADGESLPSLLDALFRLHTLRWRERGESGVLADPRLHPLHAEAAASLLRRGTLRLHALLLAGEPVAVLYGFVQRDRTYMYLSGLDPRASSCSPGMLLLHHAIAQAIGEGHAAFDMLRGDESYKDDWGVTRTPNVALRLRKAADDDGAGGRATGVVDTAPAAR